MQAEEDITDSEQAILLAAVKTFPTAYACASIQIRHRCGTVYNNVFSNSDGVRKLEDNLMNFITQKKKQANLPDFFTLN